MANESLVLSWRLQWIRSLRCILGMKQLPDYQKNMLALVRNNPELLELLLERTRLARELEAVRRKKAAEKATF